MWTIPRTIVNKILSHAQRTLPEECVGILSGPDGRTITQWHPLSNTLRDSKRFLADATEQIALFKKLREEGQTVSGIYHSHPQGPGRPSQADLDQSHYPDALYLIVSTGIDGRLDMAGYLIQEGVAHPQEITVSP